MTRWSIWMLALSLLSCTAAAGRSATAPCPPQSAVAFAPSAVSDNAELQRVNALNLPHAPGPCEQDAECFADDPCHTGLCIDHQCTGQVALNGDQCKTPLSDGSIGHCYRGRCVSGMVLRDED